MILSQSFVAFSETLNFNSPASSVHGTIGPNSIKFLMQALKCDLSAVKNIPNLILATGTSYTYIAEYGHCQSEQKWKLGEKHYNGIKIHT